jgi:hypothetical protein
MGPSATAAAALLQVFRYVAGLPAAGLAGWCSTPLWHSVMLSVVWFVRAALFPFTVGSMIGGL